MKNHVMLIVASLLITLLLIFHVSDEIARGMEFGGLNMVTPIIVVGLWLSAIVLLPARRSGYVVTLLYAILATGIPILHMTGRGLIGGRIAANTPGAFFWVTTNLLLGIIGVISIVLCLRGFWALRASTVTITE